MGFQTTRKGEAKVAATRYDLVRCAISSGTVSLVLIIVAIGNGVCLFENSGQISMIAALFITLPRQLQIIQSVFSFFNLTLSWTETYAQLKGLGNVIHLGQVRSNSPQRFWNSGPCAGKTIPSFS